MTLDVDRLIELAAMCEKASGPDRELDCDIGRALGWKSVERKYLDGARTRIGWKSPDGMPLEVGSPPYYTASLDAALSLVPEGMGYGVAEPRNGVEPSGLIFNSTGLSIEARAATPALALCAAAIRAMSAAEQKDASI